MDDYQREELPTLAQGTQAAYKDSPGRFRSYLVDQQGDPKLRDLGRADVKRCIRWLARHRGRWRKRNGGRVSMRTVAKHFRVLRRLINYAVEMEYLDAKPSAQMKEPKADDHNVIILHSDQYERLLAKAKSPMFRLYILLLGEAGLRAYSEALHLRWSDIDLAGGFMHVVSGRDGHRTKAGKSRYVPMTPRLQEAIKEHAARFRFAS